MDRQTKLKLAASYLDTLYKSIGADKGETCSVYIEDKDLEREIITVVIGSGKYRICVECDSYSAIIKEVVDETILKI